MSLTQLQEKRGELVTQARAALEEIKVNTDESRAAELETRHDTIMGELDTLDKNIEREARVAKAEKDLEEQRAKGRPDLGGREANGQDNEKPVTYRDAFIELARAGFDPQEISAEHRAALKAGATSLELRAQTAGTTTAGGYTVPTDLAA